MRHLARTFRAERIKWRKSWALLTVLLAPLCQTGFLFAILWFSEDLVLRFRPGFEFWIEVNYLTWSLVFLPIVTALVSELSWDIESEAKTWDFLLIQPIPRKTHYLAKFCSHLSLLLIAQGILAVILVPEGMILRTHLDSILGHKSIWGPAPIGTLVRFAGFSILASVPFIAAHTWLSAHVPGLGVSIATALGFTWCSAKFASMTVLMQFIPWGMTGQIITYFDRWNRHIPWAYLPGSLACALALVWLGSLDFARGKEPKQ